jgi:hypothetical protein
VLANRCAWCITVMMEAVRLLSHLHPTFLQR